MTLGGARRALNFPHVMKNFFFARHQTLSIRATHRGRFDALSWLRALAASLFFAGYDATADYSGCIPASRETAR